MNSPKFVKTRLALGVAMALGTQQAVAQDNQPSQEEETARIEEVVVTGIRRSLASAQSIKENADTFVDAITAEDIGALSDRSVAEALQRVPGVNLGRFKKTTDPDRFSVEGADVIIRGLPFVRSELNGRDVFSATGGTVLSFNDVSPELLGAVKVYKSPSADMIDGGIAGTINLVTRKPLDTKGAKFAGTVEGNYGDVAEDWTPSFSIAGSNSWDTDAGSFGLQIGVSNSELNTRSTASQVTDPCYRADTLDAGCIRVSSVSSAGIAEELNFTPDTFPPDGSVIVPKGAGVRTTGYERGRQALSIVGQWENNAGNLLVTAEYLRADADLRVDEHAMLALVNDDGLFPIPATGTDWAFNNGSFQSGTLSQVAWRGMDNCLPGSLNPPPGLERPCNSQVGVPTELLRFQREDDSTTEDFSMDVEWSPTDRLALNFEAQRVESTRSEDGIISAMHTYADIFLDLRGQTPDVEFLVPATTDGSTDPSYFTNPDRTYHWFLLDSQIENEGEMSTFRFDADYDLGRDSFFKAAKFGARWSDRERITRDNEFSNWGNLSAPWSGSATYASEPTGDVATYANVYNPFAEFQRGNTSTPVPDGAAIYFGGEDLLGEYFSGITEQQANEIHALNSSDQAWNPVANRTGVVEGTPFLPGEISDVSEETQAVYVRVDFGNNVSPDDGIAIEGNLGVRYVDTTIKADGQLQFPVEPPNDTVQCDSSLQPEGATLPGFCALSSARDAEFLAAFTGELIEDNADISFSQWLPSVNVKFGITDNFLVRAAVSKSISRPDLADYATGGVFADNTNNLRDAGTLDSGPLFFVTTGNRLLQPVTAWNYDLSAEWYFDDVGSLTASLFRKDFESLITQGATVREFTSDGGASAVVEVRGPSNVDEGDLNGFELAYQQTYHFLPAPFNNLGIQATYTYVDAGALQNSTDDTRRSPFSEDLPFVGVSEDTYNFTVFYENEKVSARLAYNWRSEFLITPRDDIFPFSPIVGEDTGQLDGSIFYTVSDKLKVGIQAVNLLDEVTKTSQIIDFDGTRAPRSAFRNDRRFTIVSRFEF